MGHLIKLVLKIKFGVKLGVSLNYFFNLLVSVSSSFLSGNYFSEFWRTKREMDFFPLLIQDRQGSNVTLDH